MSDYHHLKPGVWKKRVSTCEFSQPRADGHGRSVSRFTVISTTAETDADTVQSYDPYRGSRVFQPLNSQVSHAKIIVHRDHPTNNSQSSPPQSRGRSGSSARPSRPTSARGTTANRPPSSRGSLISLQSVRQGPSHARKPGLRHKRAVEFNHARKRSHSAQGSHRKAPQTTVDPDRSKEEASNQSVKNRSRSPEVPAKADGRYSIAKDARAPTMRANGPDTVFTEEDLRHFSSNIAKDCDNAFKSSLIEDDSIAGSLGESDRKQHDSPFMRSADSTLNMTPATDMSMKTWDSRPLPPLPSERTLHSQSMASPRIDGSSAMTLTDSEYTERSTEKASQMAVPIRFGQHEDRRVVSAPVQTHSSKRLSMMPAINENTEVNVVSHDKTRIVSAPPHTPRKRFNGRAPGIEYLNRVENSIRVVHSPTATSPVKIPAPLRVQKKSTPKNEARRHASQQHSFDDGGRSENQYAQDGGIIMKKKKAWFKRISRAESDGAVPGLRDSPDYLAPNRLGDGEDADAPSAWTAGKKKSFSFPFWKTSKSSDLKMSIAGRSGASSGYASDGIPNTVAKDEGTRTQEALKSDTVTEVENKRHSDASSHRTIEVKQNWLARLFRVKPATSHLCMTISRRRARQEVAILLREWRKYGIRGIQVDKQRNVIFARVGAKNCEYFPLMCFYL